MRNFFKQLVATLVGSFLGLVLFSIVGTTSLFVLLLLVGNRAQEPQLTSDSILVFDLSKPIQDTNPPLSFAESLLEDEVRPLTVQKVLDSLDKAETDNKIKGILLDGSKGQNATGYAVLKEIRQGLADFKASGKKVIAYDLTLSEREYYLASVADEIILNPLGNLEINGLRSEQTFFAGAFEKYGIGIQIVRVGEYKSAVEPFIRQDFSQENREQTTALLEDLWGEFLSSVGEARNISVADLQQIVDQEGLLLAKQAQELGLVDRIAHEDEVNKQLESLSGNAEEEEAFPNISIARYSEVKKEDAAETISDNKIAVLYAQGSIVNGEGALDNIGSDRVSQQIRKLREDEEVKAVVLRINSPGGSATASDVILRELKLTRDKKPVIISMGNVAASGGYWIALGGNRIFAQPNTITGSIGVFGVLPNIQEIANENGITWDDVATGDLAGLNTISRPKTEQELAVYQDVVDQIYDEFLAKVSTARDLPKEEVAKIAQGRVWSGEDAKEIGLVDELGGLESAIAHAAQASELGDDWELQQYPKTNLFEEQFLKRFTGNTRLTPSSDHIFNSRLDKLRAAWEEFRLLNDPNQAYARLPFEFWVE
ncbi:signal peptide peptidase SppA, 67K type [Halothece sp. PCC 7418]|uniref:signal peptide peptidase SppA n=1 Tax=Halothece sp. (strain PCC 7418) TaxID=65093 RepID=UPI0002A05AB1|nr:signal peptide peptidase SppA [Halothece sp. PCC 7418]AFZ43645.1 signal peptide peptidase SppA, 67K type [Halothece sp. PCC 7418]